MQEIGREHGADKAHRAEYANGRETLYRIHSLLGQGIIGHGVDQCDSRHEKGYAHAVQHEEGSEFHRRSSVHAIYSGGSHENAGDAMAHREHLLGLHLAVGEDAHQSRHEDGYQALHHEEPFDLGAHADISEIAADGRKVGAPYRELKEVHQYELDGNRFYFHRCIS